MSAEERFGNQNPTQSVILPYSKSLSQEAIDIYHKSKHQCYDWQVNMLEPIMAIDEDGFMGTPKIWVFYSSA